MADKELLDPPKLSSPHKAKRGSAAVSARRPWARRRACRADVKLPRRRRALLNV